MFHRSNTVNVNSHPTAGAFAWWSVLTLTCMITLGCGGGDFDTAAVRGTITYEGKPVTEGTIDFLPVPGTGEKMQGKPSSAKISADGTFIGSTYEDRDGVIPGMKRITYSAPLPEDSRESVNSKPSPFAGLVIEPSEIEIVKGKNDLAFTLKKP
jgi:hypothetical protein